MTNENVYEETTLDNVRKEIQNMTTAIESLERDCEMCIGTESIIGFLKDIGYYFYRGLKNIADAFAKFCTAPFASPLIPELKTFDKVKGKALRVAMNKENWDILVASSVKVPYINGCNLPLHEIGRTLDGLDKNCFDIVDKALNDVNFILSQGLSNLEFRKSNRPYDTKDTFKKANDYTDSVNKANAYIIQSDLHEDNQVLSDVVFYASQLQDCEKYINNIRKNINQSKLDRINSNVKSISTIASELAKIIDEDRFSDDKEGYPSKEFVSLVNQTLADAGKAVTALSTQFYLSTQFVRVYNFLNKDIDRFLDEAKKEKESL